MAVVGTAGGSNKAEELDLGGMQVTMDQTNNKVQRQSMISFLQLISSEEQRLYDVEDKLEDAAEGSRKRERLPEHPRKACKD